MSLLETAKRHQLNSEKYLFYLLECLPNEETLVNKEVLEPIYHGLKLYKKSANKKSPD
ncbi:transposase [Streptococcus pneumoniae]|nr:transposase [Streptococcus pneumoniae]CGF36214.1 transposase [Streptococcus pneumoniae]CNZ57608.1 transposase [Streptococcus pneumoniae]COE49459.1 transposase [Streptococcus pneumoniae]COE49497.1 transposase [Streptococcus pneumoniae]